MEIKQLRINIGKLSSVFVVFTSILLIITGLQGCSSKTEDGEQIEIISANPIAVTLRPGESEEIQFTRSNLDLSSATGSSVFNDSAPYSCTLPADNCDMRTISTSNAVTERIFNTVSFSSNKDNLRLGYSWVMSKDSRLPASVFPHVPDTASPAVLISSGWDHTLAVTADGELWAWGNNNHGQLGTNFYSDFTTSGTSSSMPVKVPFTENIRAISAGQEVSLVLTTNGNVWAWGSNIFGQLGNGESPVASIIPQRIPSLTNIVAIAAGYLHALALDDQGRVWQWGNYTSFFTGRDESEPSLVHVWGGETIDNITQIAAGHGHSLALTNTGEIWQWDTLGYPLKVKDVIGLYPASKILAGENFSVAVAGGRGYSTVMTWGATDYSQLGRDPDKFSSEVTRGWDPIPGKVDISDIGDVAVGDHFVVVLKNDGTVWTWGDNRYGQLTAGLPGAESIAPIRIEKLDGTIGISAGGSTAMAIPASSACDVGGRTGFRLLAWGDNFEGTRGDGTGVNWFAPTPVLTIGDSEVCSGLNGYRLIIYKKGIGKGTVESSAPGLTCTGMMCWQSVDVNTEITLTATPDTDSEFAEWRWDCSTGTVFVDTNPEISLFMDGVKHCKVHFDQIEERTLEVNVSGQGSVSSSPSGIDCGGDCSHSFAIDTEVTLTAEANAGNEFVAWSGDDTCYDNIDPTDAKRATINMNENINCTATFVEEGGEESGAGPIITINVFGDSANSNVTVSDIAGVQSSFECDTTTGICGKTYDPDTTLSLDTTLESGYTFSWSGGSACGVLANTNSTSFNLTLLESGDDPIITINVFGDSVNSSVTISDVAGVQSSFECDTTTGICGKTYDPNTTLSLDTTLESGYTFSWSGGSACGVLANTNSTSFNLTLLEDMNVVCRLDFEPIEPTNSLYLNTFGSGSGSIFYNNIECVVSGSGEGCNLEFNENDVIELRATASTGSVFAGWGAGCPAGSNATYTLTMPAENVTCVATFNPVAASVEVTVQNNALGNGTITSDPAGFNCHFTGSTPDVAGCETQSFASGTNLKLIATPDISPRFEGWGAVGDGDICDREPDTGPTVFSCEIDNVTSDMTAIFLMVQ